MTAWKDVVWKDVVTRALRALHLDAIGNRVLLLAVLATLIPAVATTLVASKGRRRLLNENIAQGLRGASTEAARELDLWLHQRLSELRVTAASYVLAENLARIQGQGRESAQALVRLRDFLNSIRDRLPDYEAMFVVDAAGRVVTSTTGRTGGVRLPPEKLKDLRAGDAFVGEAYWDAVEGKAVIVLAVPIRQPDGRSIGAFTAKTNLQSVTDMLQRLSQAASRDVYVVTDQGKLVIRSRTTSADLMRTRLPDTTLNTLFDREGEAVAYKRADGQAVIGALRRVPELHWAAVAEMPRAAVAHQLGQVRNGALLIILVLLGSVALMAYILELLIMRPLGRLTRAAEEVAAGDLSVDLPVSRAGELGSLTQVFNTLVARLRERESQADLERLSVTDALTGLYNRRHLMGTLASEVQRSRRLKRPFSVLLADVDHFKQYNDAQGHLAGDAALVKIAEILRNMTRGVDCVARYGGEEFLVVLLETTITTATTVAERIRSRVAAEVLEGGRTTLSIGVAECPAHGDTPEDLIASADAAMYQAKNGGRNRVVAAGGRPEAEKEKKRRRKGED